MVESAQAETTRILVPLDGSALAEQAIPYAQVLAGTSGELVFLRVMPEPEPIRGLRGNVLVPADDVVRLEAETAQQSLHEAAERWRSVLRSAPRFEVETGDPAEVILHTAHRLGCDMIAIASRGRGALGRLIFGSVADRLARSSPLPVLIVRPFDAPAEITLPPIQRLIVPLDGSPLAAEALPLAAKLAQQLRVPVHLVRAINPASVLLPSPVGAAHYPAEIYKELEEELVVEAQATLEGAATELAAVGVSTTQAVLEGPPANAIESAAVPGDLIVMTSHGRSGVGRWLLGSVAEKLIRSGPVPVILVPASTRAEVVAREATGSQ